MPIFAKAFFVKIYKIAKKIQKIKTFKANIKCLLKYGKMDFY